MKAKAAIERLQNQLRDSTALVTARDAAMAALRAEHQTAIDGLQGQIDAARTGIQAAKDGKDGEIDALKAAHTSALAAKDGEIAALTAKVPTSEAMDKLIEERGRTLTAARKFLGGNYTGAGKNDDQIRRDACARHLTAAVVDAQPDEYVRTAFDTMVAIASRRRGPDPIQRALEADNRRRGSADQQQDREAARDSFDAMVSCLQNAWKAAPTVH